MFPAFRLWWKEKRQGAWSEGCPDFLPPGPMEALRAEKRHTHWAFTFQAGAGTWPYMAAEGPRLSSSREGLHAFSTQISGE